MAKAAAEGTRTAMSKDTTDETFQADVLDSSKPVVVDFWAPWCGPCKALSPVIDQIGEEYAELITVVKINVDENPDTATEYGITSIPAIKVFYGGSVQKTIMGAKPKPALIQDLSPFIGGAL